jgi:DNA end-binding protein Ku
VTARAIWKGVLHIGSAEVPVKLHAAVEDRAVHFRLLDAARKEPVRQRMVNPDTGKPIEPDDIRRAVALDGGEMVLLEPDELAEIEPPASRDIRLTRFVPPSAIEHVWYDRPYHLSPDGDDDAYWALAAALAARPLVGIARWTMRKKEYAGAVLERGGYLGLVTLRAAGEVVPASALEPPAGRALDAREVGMAKQLVAAMEGALDLEAFRDDYRDRVRELVEAKAQGKLVKFPRAPSRPRDDDLAAALERSLQARSGTGEKRRKRA